MIAQIKRWLDPSDFALDDKRDTQARVINLLFISLGVLLLTAIFMLVPLFVVKKIEAWTLLGCLFLGVATGGLLIHRGYPRLGAPILVATAWIFFLLLTLVSGGPANPALFFLASTTLVAGYTLGSRYANGLTLLTLLTGLGIIFLSSHGLALPLIFQLTPLTGWLAFGLGLVFMNSVQNISIHHLENANTKARQEIATRRQIEQTLQESETRYKSLFENNHAVMLIIDPTSATLVDANPAACAYYGWSRSEMWNKKVGSINVLTEAEILAEMRLAAAQMRNHFYFKHRLADGSIRDVEVYSGPLVQTGKTLLCSIVHDITDRKQTEEALRDSEEKFRLSFMTGLDAFFISRLDDGQFIEINQVFEEVFGYSRDEIIGKTPIQLDIYENPTDRATLISELLAKGNIRDRELKGKKKNGESITISLSSNLILINHQNHVLGVIRDITERKQAQEHLELLKYSIDTSPDGAYWFNPEGSFLYVNESGCKSLGYSMEELLRLRISDINLRSTPQRWAEVWKTIKEKKVFTVESVHRRKDGSEFPVEITSTYVKFGDLEYCNGFARDITARKLTEQTLLEKEDHFRAVVQTANDAIITIDSGGMIVAWNTAAETIFGYSTNEAVGMPVSQITPAQFISPHSQGLERAMGGNDRQIVGKTVEVFGLAKDGREFPIEMSLAEWNTQAGHFFTAIMRDTSERKQREKELHAISSLSAALRTAPTRAEMLPVIVEELSSLLNCDSISAEIIDPKTNEAVVEAACGVWTPFINSRQPAGTGLNAIIQKTRQRYHNNNLKDDSRIGFPYYLLEKICAGAGVPLIAQDQLIGFLWMGKNKAIAETEVRLLAAVADIAANALYRATLHERTRQDAADLSLAYDTTLEGWAHALELRDQETVGHTRRVVQMTVDLAKTMGIGADQVENLRRGALLHDIGKMGIPDSVLLKPGTLNDREWEIMKRHPEYAYQFLEPIEYLRPALSIPYCHHEKWDGSGYPRGLKGNEIPIEARIFAIVDVWDALRSDRPYRKAWTSEKTRNYIIEQNGTHFDPAVVQAFLEMLGDEYGEDSRVQLIG